MTRRVMTAIVIALAVSAPFAACAGDVVDARHARLIASAVATAGAKYGQTFRPRPALRASRQRSRAEKALIGAGVGATVGAVFGGLTSPGERSKGVAVGALGAGAVGMLFVLKECKP
jgi:hypothetical protein